MKANLKGLGGIKGLLLLHGEKVAIAVVGLLALWFIYSSMSLPRLEDNRQAANLQNEIQLTRNAVDESKWPDAPDAPGVDEIRISRNMARTDEEFMVKSPHYALQGSFNKPVVDPAVLRTDPVLLNAVDVHAVGGTGIFAFIDEAVRQARALADREKAEALERQQRREAERQEQMQADGRNPRGRDEGYGRGEPGAMPLDPDHPNRRLVEGMVQPAGAPLQGDERQERTHWAIITAKVPIREQLKLYQDAFENARDYDPTRDFPRYVGYKVQRAEVVPGQPLEWKNVPVYDGQRQSVVANDSVGPFVAMPVLNKLYERITKFWATQLPDVVDQRFLVDVLALPLPPLVGRDWGAEATHPDIPLLEDTPPMEEEIEPLAEATTDEPAETDEAAMFRSTDPAQSTGMGVYGGEGGAMGGRYGGERGIGGVGRYGGGDPYGRGSSPYGRGAAGVYGGGRYGSGGMGGRGGIGPYGEGGGRGAAYGSMGGRAGGQPMVLPRGVDFWLLRFFDFSVEPGKKYKYRVRMVLADPNVGMRDSALAPAVLDRLAKIAQDAKAKNTRRSEVRYVDDWSEPSRTAGIPIAGSVKLAASKPSAAGRVGDEPTVNLLVESFDVDASGNAIQAGTQRDFRRGYVANMITKDQEYLGPGGQWIDELESFKFFTGMTVLDMEGGETLGKDTTAPARVLLMDPAGELHIRSEMDDKSDVDYHKLIFEKKKSRDGEMERSPYGGEGGGRYGPGPYGGGGGRRGT
jgi:hypothetical protein